MQRSIQLTKDGSHTIAIPAMAVTYHSVHGAIQESLHVFIEAGFYYYVSTYKPENVAVLEMGFGTGLNALLTMMALEKTNTTVYYVSVEKFPLTHQEVATLNYCQQVNRQNLQDGFMAMHTNEWNQSRSLQENFILNKSNSDIRTFSHPTNFDIIYFDAFAPATQPALWTVDIFTKLFQLLNTNGILVTYCSKGDVRRALLAAGFKVEKIPGPPGKREMLRATKQVN
ncbi:MAG: tRNA (5-methylaminomethyl-2-thiouridine)(34)-methyltransferase MnmD [Bacteroidota bacterium]|jgi:tRNA U34 5-methylaminomethyl-2-thiouridine-forming methyltransferase MnmC